MGSRGPSKGEGGFEGTLHGDERRPGPTAPVSICSIYSPSNPGIPRPLPPVEILKSELQI